VAVTGTVYLTGELLGNPEGRRNINLSWSITAGAFAVKADLASGDNDLTTTIPSGTTLIVVIPPTSNTQALKLKGAAGDTGVRISPTKPHVHAWGAAGSFIVNAAGTVTGAEIQFI